MLALVRVPLNQELFMILLHLTLTDSLLQSKIKT